MSGILDGCYLKTGDSQLFWAVDGGQRHPVSGPAEMYALGLRPVIIVAADVLDAIPLECGEEEGSEEE